MKTMRFTSKGIYFTMGSISLLTLLVFLSYRNLVKEPHPVLSQVVSTSSLHPTIPEKTPSDALQATQSIDNTFALTPTHRPFDPSVTPTKRIFAFADRNCSNAINLGHISYRDNSNLYAMNGDGCFPKLLMKDASISPVWAPNGEMIAAGCNKESEICILDTRSIFDRCVDFESETVCQATTQATYPLCQQQGCRIQNLSWSPDMSKLAVTYRYRSESAQFMSNICIFSLRTGECENIMTDEAGLWVDWSPVENRLAVSNLRGELFLLDPDGKNRTELAYGINPAWSPDGTHIGYLKPSEDQDKEFFGIASIDVDSAEWKWLYPPAHRDRYYSPPQNIGVGCGNTRGITWSPDAKYIAFPVRYYSMFDCQIMRLDVETQAIIFLTSTIASQSSNHNYYDPDWGP